MAVKSADTLKGKVLIATSVLAFFICTFGLISYLVVSLLVNDGFYGVFIPFLFLGITVMIFGGWLSNQVVNPIEKITLLAKSLERGASTSLPETTGSYETDQLLQTLHRNSQQTQKLITLMDKVAGGEISVALTPLQDSDRLTASFQKLLAKFSESIHAKEDLTKLQNELGEIKREISTVRNGNFDVKINSDYFQTKEISETFRYLIEHLNAVVSQLKADSTEIQAAALSVGKAIDAIVQKDENRIVEMNQAAIILKQIPGLIKNIPNDRQSEETDRAFEIFINSIGETEISVAELKNSALQVKELSNVMKNLQSMISEYRLIQTEVEEYADVEDIEAGFLNFTQDKVEKESAPVNQTDLQQTDSQIKSETEDFDDLQIVETKVSYETGELLFDFENNTPSPTPVIR